MNAFLEGDVQRSLNAMQEIQDRCRTCCEYRLHEELTGAIKHSCRDRILVNVESDVSEAIHLGTPFSVSPVLLRTVDGQRSVAYGNDDNWAGATLLYRVAPAHPSVLAACICHLLPSRICPSLKSLGWFRK